MDSPIIAKRTITLGSDSFDLLYEPLHWRLAERELGIPMMPPLATPFWEPYTQMVAGAVAAHEGAAPIPTVSDSAFLDFLGGLIYVGIRHSLAKNLRNSDAFNDWLAARVTWESLSAQSGEVIGAVTDFFLRRVEAAKLKAEAENPETEPEAAPQP